MKTLGRILILLAVTVALGAAIYFLVDSNASSLTPGGFAGDEQFRPDSERPTFPEGTRPEGHERGEMGGGWMFGLVKNVGVIAIFVAIIVLPSSLRKKKRITAQTNGGASPSN